VFCFTIISQITEWDVLCESVASTIANSPYENLEI
jgi:hypothetical protein